jgi:hypothetical protein
VQPTPPIASFTFSPASPVAGQAVSFNATSSTCPDGPCTYEWSDDGGTTRPIPALWPLGSGQTLQYTFSAAGTKYMRLVVTDATGQTATVEHNIVVAEPTPPPPPLPPPPSAPTISAMPAITGLATAGETLNATAGAWTGSPTAYAYQWRHCTSSASGCTSIAGAVASSYRLASGDVGQRMSVTVTATNAGGSSSANAPMTAMVTAPLPPAPVNTAPPKISGSAVEGQTLSVTTGAWTGEPTSYSYRWQDCNALGEGCLNVSAATDSSYTLAASNVGSTVRVLVTATNEGGSTSISSTATALVAAIPPPPPPPPTPPTASFTYSPLAPVTGQQITFDGASSTCSDGPCSYQWSDDGGTTRPVPALWPLGDGQTLQFAFSGAGTKYVRLLVTDAAGQTATVEHNVVVAEPTPPPPPPPVAPSNTAAPVVSGTPEVGQTLSASNGTWSGSTPMSDTYQWQDCSASGEMCANIGTATASSYKPAASDVGHTLRVVVTASNAGGSTQASSVVTATVAAQSTPPVETPPVESTPPSVPSLTAKECWEEPGKAGESTAKIEACGYPGFNNTGVEAGQSLTSEAGTVVFTSTGWENTTTKTKGSGNYEDRKLKGEIKIRPGAKPALLENDEVYTEAKCKKEVEHNEPCSISTINFEASGNVAASGFVFSHMRVGGTEIKGENSVQNCINDRYSGTWTGEYLKCIYGGGFVLNGGGELNHVYCPNDQEETGAHYECVEDEGGTPAQPLKVYNSTVFNGPTENWGETDAGGSSAGATAAAFRQPFAGEVGEWVFEKDLMAGGAYTIYAEGEASVTVKSTRFARCSEKTCPKTSAPELAGDHKQLINDPTLNTGDGHGWWENSGLYGVWSNGSAHGTAKSITWTGNFWDNNLETVGK